MTARATDHAVRDLWQLHEDAIFGRTEQVIWQPRIGCWFTDKQFEHEPLPAPYTGLDMPGIYQSLGVSNRLYEYNASFVPVEDPRVTGRHEALDEMTTQVFLDTPVGQQTWITRRATTNIGTIWVKRPISSIEELRVATWRCEHTTFRFEPERFEQVRERWGRNGAPTIFMPRVNVQDLYINTMVSRRRFTPSTTGPRRSRPTSPPSMTSTCGSSTRSKSRRCGSSTSATTSTARRCRRRTSSAG